MKKGLSTIVTLLIIVLFVVIAIGIIWAFIVPLIEEQSELSEAQARLLSAEVQIVDVVGTPNLDDPTHINIVITRGRDNIFKSEITEEELIPVDVMSVSDLSSSMIEDVLVCNNDLICNGDEQPDSCSDCVRIEAEDAIINSPMITDGSVKYVYTTITDEVSGSGSVIFNINIPSNGNYKIGAKVRGMSGDENSFFVDVNGDNSLNDQNSYDVPVIGGFLIDEVSRRGTGTSGSNEFNPMIWNLNSGKNTITFHGREMNTRLDYIWIMDDTPKITKISESKEANKNFAENVFDNTNNHFGIVAFSSDYIQVNSFPLSSSSELANIQNKIDGWVPGGDTCICCGIAEAIEQFNSFSGNIKKAIVVMSDGSADPGCSGYGFDDAQDAAEEAFNIHGIIVYTIGFGTSLNQVELESIANAGGGLYFHASNGQLNTIYEQVQLVITEVKNLDSHIKIVFYGDTETFTYTVDTFPPPLGSKSYSILPVGDLPDTLNNVNKIEVYAVIVTDSGREVGTLIETWRP
jgi:hypothetical protein